MQLAQGSVACRLFLFLWQALYALYEQSLLARGVRAVAAWWKRWWHGSAAVHFFFEKDGFFSRTWRHSLVCRLLTVLINLPVVLLHWLHETLRPVWEASFFAQLAFGMGEQVPAATGWLMLAIMIVPYERWNNAYSLIGYVLVLLLVLAGGMRRRSLRLDVVHIGPYFLCYFLAVCLSWPLSLFPELSFRYLVYHFSCALCMLVIVSTVEREEQLVRLAGFGCLGMGAASVLGILQRVNGLEVNRAYVDLSINGDLPSRIYSVYENPNAFAQMLVFVVPVAIGLLFGARSLLWKAVGLGTAGLGALALIMTYSRASWVSIAVAAVVFVFLWNRRLLPVFIGLGVMAIPFLPSHIQNRIMTIFSTRDASTNSRVPLYEAAIRAVKQSPITGAGLGGDAVRQMIDENKLYYDLKAPFTHSHNIYLQLWLEHGLLGVLTFAVGCYNAVKQGAKAIALPHCPPQTKLIIIGAASGIAGSMVGGMADYLFTYPRVMLIFWFAVALLLAGVRLARQKRAA